MQHTVFANKPAPSTGAEYANSDRRTGFAHVSRSACHGRAASPAFDGCVRYARSDSHYARASSAGLFSRGPVRGSRLRPRKDASIIRPYAIMAGVLVVVAVVVAVCATVGRGCVDAGTASGPGAIAGSISTPVGEWSQGLVDYVARDVKNAPERSAETVGVDGLDLARVHESVSFLLEGSVPYEFRTTVVRELHAESDLRSLAEWIAGAEAWFLQSFIDEESVLGGTGRFHAWEPDELRHILPELQRIVPTAALRGIDL